MERVLVLGAGTAGIMVANRLRRVLDVAEWQVRVVDRTDQHIYQPGLLFVPFGKYSAAQLTKATRKLLAPGVDFVPGTVDRVDPARSVVHMEDGRVLGYDRLIVATGTSTRPDQTPGMQGSRWHRDIFDFYTLDGAFALREALQAFSHGRIVVHVTELPIKCPVAPLEFAFLTDAWLRRRGTRDQAEIVYVTPLSGAFTKPVAAAHLAGMLADRGILLEPDFMVERVEDDRLVSYDEREVPFDLLVTVPLNMGAEFISRSGLGDELNYVPVDRHTMQSVQYPNIFAVGDAANLPTSKAGSVAHFSVDGFVDNFVDHLQGRPMTRAFDGHANCFVESGRGKALLIDFDYETEPLPGSYPLPVVGPLRLLRESRLNHLGKLAFRWLYWHVLLPGRPLPLPSRRPRSKQQPQTQPMEV